MQKPSMQSKSKVYVLYIKEFAFDASGFLGPCTWICRQLRPKRFSGLKTNQLATSHYISKFCRAYLPAILFRKDNFFKTNVFISMFL